MNIVLPLNDLVEGLINSMKELANRKDYCKVIFVDNNDELVKADYKYEGAIVIIRNDYGKRIEYSKKEEIYTLRKLLVGLIISSVYVFIYLIIYGYFKTNECINLFLAMLYQLALSYIAGIIIFYLSEIISKKYRRKKIVPVIKNRIMEICYFMSEVVKAFKNAEIDEGFKQYDFNNNTDVVSINYIGMTNFYITSLECVAEKTKQIKNKAKELLGFYYSDLPMELVVLLDAIIYTYINLEGFDDVLRNYSKIDIVGGDDILEEYIDILEELKKWGYSVENLF